MVGSPSPPRAANFEDTDITNSSGKSSFLRLPIHRFLRSFRISVRDGRIFRIVNYLNYYIFINMAKIKKKFFFYYFFSIYIISSLFRRE